MWYLSAYTYIRTLPHGDVLAGHVSKKVYYVIQVNESVRILYNYNMRYDVKMLDIRHAGKRH